MAETLTTLKTRRSCRAYKPEHIEEEKLNAILEAGTYAATGMGKQSPIILVIKDPE
ncbi:MAG: nitroreductase family protein, partial [Clostridia bacterium]|nr:nitroreductase family protein [Clostridia bacterium]